MVIVLSLTTFFSTSIGGLVALRAKDRMHLVLGLAAGVMLGLVAFDLLPEIAHNSSLTVAGIPAAMIAFSGGFLVLHVVERALAVHPAHEEEYGEHAAHRHRQIGLASAAGLVGHSFLDGVGIGLAFQVNTGVGLAVAIAVIAHDFADGLNTVTVMLVHRNNRRRAILMLVLDALAPVLGAASTLLFHLPEPVLAIYLGLFAGFLLYLATADILPEAHARHPSRLTLLATLAGAAAMFGIVSAINGGH